MHVVLPVTPSGSRFIIIAKKQRCQHLPQWSLPCGDGARLSGDEVGCASSAVGAVSAAALGAEAWWPAGSAVVGRRRRRRRRAAASSRPRLTTAAAAGRRRRPAGSVPDVRTIAHSVLRSEAGVGEVGREKGEREERRRSVLGKMLAGLHPFHFSCSFLSLSHSLSLPLPSLSAWEPHRLQSRWQSNRAGECIRNTTRREEW